MRKVSNPIPAPTKSNARFHKLIPGEIPKRYIPNSESSASTTAAINTIGKAFRRTPSCFACFLHEPNQMWTNPQKSAQ